MRAPATTDAHGNRYAAVHVEELDDWAWVLARLEDWLSHAQPETAEDWAEVTGPCGARLEDIASTLGRWAARMRDLAEGRQ